MYETSQEWDNQLLNSVFFSNKQLNKSSKDLKMYVIVSLSMLHAMF